MGGSAVRLEVVAGNAVGTSILVEDELVIGRHAEGAERLGDDEEISRRHARISVDADGSCAIEDLESTNGTFVNGLRMSAPRMLAEGDTIEVGGTTLVVRELPDNAPAPPAPPAPAPASPGVQSTAVNETAGAPDEPTPAPVAEPTPTPALEQEPGAGQPVAEAPEFGVAEPPIAGPEPLGSELPPPLLLKLRVDFAEREAQILLDDESEPVRLIFEDGAWRAVATSPRPDG
jgi:pSer/pThr/pTyr-binding forkhead associated (FHA) protein